MEGSKIDISVVVPLFNEDESLNELFEWIDRVLKENSLTYEVVFVDDGSKDNSWNIIEELIHKNPKKAKGIKFQRNYGKSAALHVGFQKAIGEVVITMDADLQDSPEEIPELRRMILEDGYDLVSGWKKKRYDPLTKTIPTKLFNAATRKMSGIYLNDFNCGLKAYKNKVIKSVEVYGEMHRYIPVLAKWAGFSNIGEKVVHHQARKYGVTKFGMNRFVNGFLDLLTVTFISKFGKKPMHFFGLWGSILFILGVISAVVIGGIKLYYLSRGTRAPLVTDTPYFYFSLTFMILGTQLFLSGFIGEMIGRNSSTRNTYLIEKEV